MDGLVQSNGEEFGSVTIENHNSRKNPTKPSLDQLPTELILEIIKYLSVESQAALVFTNKRLKHVIGSDPWRRLKSEEHSTARKDFIRRLEQDDLNWKFCSTCELLHPAQLIPSLWKQVESEKYAIVGAPRTLPYFRIYRDHLKGAFQRQICGKPVGCCLEIFKQAFPPTFPKTKLAEAVFKDIETATEVSTRLHDVDTHVRRFIPQCPRHFWDATFFTQQSPRYCISWDATFSFKFSKHKTDDEVLKLVELLQADGFRICSHLVWGVPTEHGTECASVNNFVWGRFAQPECHKDIPRLNCALCETSFDITFIHGPLPRSRLVMEMRIKINKTWSVIREWSGFSSSTEVLVGNESFEDPLLTCGSQYELFPPTSFEGQKGQTSQSKRRSWRNRIKLVTCW